MKPENPATTGRRREAEAELLSLLLAEEGLDPGEARGIPRRPAGEPVPLSFAQERLWFLDQLVPGNVAYNIPTAVDFSGPLKVGAFAAALSEIVRRHEVLRTRFPAVAGRAEQEVLPPAPLPVPLVDLSALPAAMAEALLGSLALAEGKRPFDLARGPLLRVQLLRLEALRYRVILTVHHTVFDGWSRGVLLRELEPLYRALAAGGPPPPLPEPAIQYGDFALWQRRQLAGEAGEQLLYWRRTLADVPVLRLPTDRPRPALQSFRGRRLEIALSPRASAGLAALARRRGATLFMALLALLAELLARWSTQRDFALGTPVAGRDRLETEELIGLFLDTLALRVRLDPAASYGALLTQVRAETLAAFAHPLPFAKLVEDLAPERDLSHPPLFQVMLAVQNLPALALALPGVTATATAIDEGGAKLDLSIALAEGRSRLAGTLSYNRDLFDAATLERFAAHLTTLAEAVVENPGQRLADLSVLGPAERHALIAEWNDTALSALPGSGLHQLVEAQAARTPTAVAVVFEGSEIDYCTLDHRASRLARRLAAAGVRPEVTVAVVMERSIEMVVALFGVLKAGGAYVPLDPDAPPAHCDVLLADSAAALVLTQERFRDRLPAGRPVLVLEPGFGSDGGEGGEIAPERAPSSFLGPKQLAYVIYTSGSTGRPKAAMNSHGGIVNRILWMQAAYGLDASDRVLQKTPYTFDVSVWELFWPLSTGARLVMARPGGHRDTGYLADTIVEQGITTLHFVPSMLQLFLEDEGVAGCRSLRRVMASGEALPRDLAGRFAGRLGAELHNLYGPTEAAVDVTYWPLQGDAGTGPVPIGRPISNLRVHVLDGELRPVPIGVAGELLLGGVGMGRGYLGQPAHTAERFVPDPVSERGGRLYRTGDLARHRPDGAVEFLGRLDHQVKVRGFRIEPGEIEAALLRHPGIRETVVVVHGKGGEARLAAYLVAEGGEIAVEDLRRHLRELLPEFMVPALFIPLARLPLSANGKVDRRALPEPQGERPNLEEGFVPPQGETEETLARIWSQVLGVDRVGARDNFFALGGDSIRSVRVLALAREAGLELSLTDLFQHRTVRELAAEVRAAAPTMEPAARSAPFSLLSEEDRRRLPGGLEDAYPLTRLQEGMLYHMELTPGAPLYHNVNSFRLRARLDVAALAEAVRRVVARHPVLRTSFALAGFSEPLQLVHQHADLPLTVGELGALAPAEQEAAVEAFVRRQAKERFDLARPPLLRLHLHRLGDESHQLTVVECHAVSDGWSLHATLAEIFRLYSALAAGEDPPPQPPPAATFRDYVALERAALASPASRDFWQRHLDGAAAARLPRWPAASRTGTAAGTVNLPVPIPPRLSDRLQELARQHGLPLKSFLLAVHVRVLATVCGTADVVTGLTSHGRPEELDGEEVRGLFLNTLPFRLRVGGGSWLDLVRRAFAAEREILPHRRFPLAELPRLAGRPEIPETDFNYIHFHVAQGISRSSELTVLGSRKSEHTAFVLGANFGLDPGGRRVILELELDPREVAAEQGLRVGDCYRRALEALAESPEGAHGASPLLDGEEVDRLLAWGTGPRRGPALPVARQISASAAAAPASPALVVAGGSGMTFADLEVAANRLAHHLLGLGAGPEQRVALVADSSPQAIVALVALLKVGAAYVPLDPRAPAARQAQILAEAAPLAVLVEDERTAGLAGRYAPAAALVRLDRPEVWAAVSPAAPGGAMPEEAAAYVIYTSGSTGHPKGVVIPHGALASHVRTIAERYRLEPGERVLQFAPLTFDVAAEEIFSALAAGAALVLPERGAGWPPPVAELLRLVQGLGISVLNLPTAYWHEWVSELEAGGGRPPESLRLVVVGTERAEPERLATWLCQVGGRPQWINAYGPTEATVTATTQDGAALAAAYLETSVPVGRPLPGVRAYVLDGELQLLPAGSPGELYLGGAGLARGYLGRAVETALSWRPDALSGAAGERLYATGDRARLMPDGTLDLLGRLDDQVKLRGFRIEPGEIESALAAHPAVRLATVVLRADDGGEARLVAYVVPRVGVAEAASPEALCDHLRQHLPGYMVPSAVVALDALPLTPSGKVDRRALPAPARAAKVPSAPPSDELERRLVALWAEVLSLAPDQVGREHHFFELGGDSIRLLRLHRRIVAELGHELPMVALFEHPTVGALAARLRREGGGVPAPRPITAMEAVRERAPGPVRRGGWSDGIAVVGMAGRFAKAPDLATFWSNLCQGVEAVTFFSEEELVAAGLDPVEVARPDFVKATSLLEGIDLFDADFFGFSRREAEITDPQQRIFLECAWEALEHAGYDPRRTGGAVGVYCGVSLSQYLVQLYAERQAMERVGTFRAKIGNDKDHLATWVSYKLGLTGPSLSVQTACSTSLVAVHLACQALLLGECDLALAGGASISELGPGGYRFVEGGIRSSDGHCRAFAADASGTVGGNGAGVVVLKRLADALADGDTLYAVVRGSAVNNDGDGKVGYTAPAVEGQARVVARALAVAGVAPRDVSFIEAHGTGTRLGDPIEVEALVRAFADAPVGGCALGSVKTNLGHLDAAAGIAGLLKTVLSLNHRTLVPSLHFERPNPDIPFASTPFFVNTELRPWSAPGGLLAGVSSFGIGGTNAHLVVAEAPASAPGTAGREAELLVLSARTPEELAASAGRLAAELGRPEGPDLADVAHTLQTGRRPFAWRAAWVCRSRAGAAAALAEISPRRAGEAALPVAFLFPGQGMEGLGPGLALCRAEPVFKKTLEEAAEALAPELEVDPRLLLFPAEGEAEGAAALLLRTDLAQPVLFAVEVALAQLWTSWGIVPDALLGHSAGEYAAACVAGVFSFADALRLMAARGRLLERLPRGAMLAVSLAEEEVARHLAGGLSLAAVNAPRRSVVSGPEEEIEALARALAAAGTPSRRLATSRAFHSAAMEPARAEMAALVARARPAPPRIPLLSNLTGGWMTAEQATDPDYWARQLRAPVRFADGVKLLLERDRALLEVGPGRQLSALAQQVAGPGSGALCVASVPRPESADDRDPLLAALGRLWCAGVEVDWQGLRAGERRRRVPLPTYPFNRQRYWVDRPRPARRPAAAGLEPEAAPAAPAMAPEAPSRLAEIRAGLGEIISDLVGTDPALIDADATFLELGVDSLLLIQANQAIERHFGVRLSLVQLLEETSSVAAVARHLAAVLPATLPAPRVATPPPAGRGGEEASALLARQLDLLERQLAAQARQQEFLERQLELWRGGTPAARPAVPPPAGAAASDVEGPRPMGPYQPLAPGGAAGELPAAQQRFLDAFIAGYGARTRTSKARADAERRVHADNRASMGFRRLFKELVYPIIGERSAGSRLWDVDGNEYVDLTMGFGVHLFGHSPRFIVAALEEQLARGFALGPQSDLAGPVAERICRLTGMERVAFTNSGTEAVMAALRIARAATGRHKVALFAGSYHGSFDGTLARPLVRDGRVRAVPTAPGVPPEMVADLVVLDYGEASALETLERHRGELAAVLVEPIQSRRPELVPREFLHELRRATAASRTALIFDEIITGFRMHPGGAQALFGVAADLAVYGKVLAGGLPIGVVTGRSPWIDAVDGGPWRFGDGSYPRVDKTFFAGTFSKHPLALAASRAVLERLAAEGEELPARLDRLTGELARRLDAVFAAAGVPARIARCGSLFNFRLDPAWRHSELFFYQLVHRGIYLWEGRTCFLSTAHTAEDLDRVVAAVEESLGELGRFGFLPAASPPSAAAPPAPGGSTAPATEEQQGLWAIGQLGTAAACAFTEALMLKLSGPLRQGALARAVERLVARHEALRTTFSADGRTLRFAPRAACEVPLLDLSALPAERREEAARGWLEQEAWVPFDLERGPLFSLRLAMLAAGEHRLRIALHHLISDGWTFGVLVEELRALYAAACRGEVLELPPATPFGDYARRRAAELAGEEAARCEAYWMEQFAGGPPLLALPLDHPRPPVQSFRGGKVEVILDGDLLEGLAAAGRQGGATLLMTLLAAFDLLLHHLSGQPELVVGVHSAGQAVVGARDLVGFCIQMLPIKSRIGGLTRFTEHLAQVRRHLTGAWEHRSLPFGRLVRRLGLRRDPGRPPLVGVVFNLDTAGDGDLRFHDLVGEVVPEPTVFAKFDMFWNLTRRPHDLVVECIYARDLFRPATVERWVGYYAALLRHIAERPDAALAEVFAAIPEADRRRDEDQGERLVRVRSQKIVQVRRRVIEIERAGP